MEYHKNKSPLINLYSGFDRKCFNTGAIFEMHKAKNNTLYIFPSTSSSHKIPIKPSMLSINKLKSKLRIGDFLITDGPFPTLNPFKLCRFKIIVISHGHLVKKQGIDGYRGWRKIYKYLLIRYRSFFVNEFWTTAASQIKNVQRSYLVSKNQIKIVKLPKYCLQSCDRYKLLDLVNIDWVPKKIVLVAPTWQKSRFGSTDAGLDFFDFLSRLHKKQRAVFEEKKILFLVRPHPISCEPSDQSYSFVRMIPSSTIELIEPFLSAFDLVVSDYSGILVDTAAMNVPAIAYLEGIENFKKNKGLYDGIEELLMKIGVYTYDELFNYLVFQKRVEPCSVTALANHFFDEDAEPYINRIVDL